MDRQTRERERERERGSFPLFQCRRLSFVYSSGCLCNNNCQFSSLAWIFLYRSLESHDNFFPCKMINQWTTVRCKGKSHQVVVTYSKSAIRYNHTTLEYCGISMSALAGCTAGFLGLRSHFGFIFYITSMLIFWLLLLAEVGPSWDKYFRSRLAILTESVTSGLFTYVLFWTLLYGMIHAY